MKAEGPAAVIGVSLVGPFRHQERSGLDLAVAAVRVALDDAGLDKAELDGLFVNMGGPTGPDVDQLAQLAGLDIAVANQTWPHGRLSGSVIQHAALAIAGGLTRYAACVYAYNSPSASIGGPRSAQWVNELRYGGGPHAEEPAIGLAAPIGLAAQAARLYCDRYRIDPQLLYGVVKSHAEQASLNPRALRRSVPSLEQYLATPIIAAPFRRLDCSPVTEGAVCLILGPSTAADQFRHLPVYLRAMQGLPVGREEFIWARRGLGIRQQSADGEIAPARIYADAGMTPADIDLFYTYDAFSSLVWFALERFGFCGPGQAPAFVGHGYRGEGRSIAVDTHGGLLSAGHLSIFGHAVELVTQLRHEAGERQQPQADVAMWGACFGDAIIFTSS